MRKCVDGKTVDRQTASHTFCGSTNVDMYANNLIIEKNLNK